MTPKGVRFNSVCFTISPNIRSSRAEKTMSNPQRTRLIAIATGFVTIFSVNSTKVLSGNRFVRRVITKTNRQASATAPSMAIHPSVPAASAPYRDSVKLVVPNKLIIRRVQS